MELYHFGLSWDYDVEERFVALLKQFCQEAGLSFLWISGNNIKEITRRLEDHTLKISVLLDLQATYNKEKDLYVRLCYGVKDSGGAVINDPDRTRTAIDKSAAHFELINAGIPTPHTIVVRNWEPNRFRLTDEERRHLGVPFIIKPAFGYGQLGVVRDARGTVREIATARQYDRGDNFLLQEKIQPVFYQGRRAWFRVIHVLDTLIPCWWDDQENRYVHVSFEEFNSLSLYPLVKFSSQIAAFSKMAWFSTEIAVDKKDGKKRFVAIDYINDQCDMSMQSETPSGVPDTVVEYTARKLVGAAGQAAGGAGLSKKYKIFLKDAMIELRGLGVAQDLLKQE